MSKILPFDKSDHFGDEDNDKNSNTCPRYEKWVQRQVGHLSHAPGHNRKRICNNPNDNLRRRRKIDRSTDCDDNHNLNDNSATANNSSDEQLSSTLVDHQNDNKSFRRKSFNSKRNRQPLRSRSIFKKIRQKGRNFGIRCRTSVDLWRKWIRRGIGWDRRGSIGKLTMDKHQKGATVHHKTETTITTKGNDFVKKSIINEVIPEEDELVEPEQKQQPTTAAATTEKGNDQMDKDKQHSVTIPTIEINQKQDNNHQNEKIEKLKNIFSRNFQQEKHNNNNGSLSTIDFDKIEHLSSSTTQKNDNESKPFNDDNDDDKPIKSKSSLRRAFNKLKIFF